MRRVALAVIAAVALMGASLGGPTVPNDLPDWSAAASLPPVQVMSTFAGNVSSGSFLGVFLLPANRLQIATYTVSGTIRGSSIAAIEGRFRLVVANMTHPGNVEFASGMLLEGVITDRTVSYSAPLSVTAIIAAQSGWLATDTYEIQLIFLNTVGVGTYDLEYTMSYLLA